MTINTLALASNLIFSAMSAFIVIKTAKLIGRNDRSLTAVFFTFSSSAILLSYIYWLAYELLRPDVRMPFAPNEVGEMACNLLLASAMTTVFTGGRLRSYKEAVFGILFQIVCIFLWIGWSGEWIQDIISGIAMCYLIYVSVKALLETEVFSKTEWRIQGVLLALLAALQGLTFLLNGSARETVDIICYVLIFAICIFYTVKVVRMFRSGADSKALLSVSCVSFIYGMNAMYMSAEPMYYAAEVFCELMFLMTAVSVWKVVMEE